MEKKTVEIDARTSDAVALAVRFGTPIYAYDFILSSAGIVIEGNEFAFLENLENAVNAEIVEDDVKEEKSKIQNPFSSLTDEQLKTVLEQSLHDENYEQAALIRDEISRRK